MPDSLFEITNSCNDAKALLDVLPIIDINSSDIQLADLGWASELPRVFPVESCISGHIPTHEELYDVIDELKPKDRAGFKYVLADSLQREPASSAMNIPVPSSRMRIHLPNTLPHEIVNRADLEHITMNIANNGAYVNWHVDMGMAGLSAIAGACEKTWLFAELTQHNFEQFMKWQQSATRPFDKLLVVLEKVFVLRQASTGIVWVPPGAIHATFTTSPGFLYGNNLQIRPSIGMMSMGFITVLNDKQITDQARVAGKYIEHVLDVIRNGDLELQMLALSWFCDKRIRTVACKRKWLKKFAPLMDAWVGCFALWGQVNGPYNCVFIFHHARMVRSEL